MTDLRRVIQRETRNLYRGRPLCVELHPGFLVIWPKGTRYRRSISYEAIFSRAVMLHALAEQSRVGGGLRRRRVR
ncbi:MAG: hypothetical protein FJW34_00200 [Acidobacteria bacterium]|nr:hypothetical protein [Acidobacteriota bacterium]